MEEKTSSDKSSNTVMAVLSYFGILVLIPLLTDAKKDPFVKFHIKQGLVLLIVFIIAWVMIPLIPFIGWILSIFVLIFVFILFLIGVINAASGKKEPLPVIGQYGDKFKI